MFLSPFPPCKANPMESVQFIGLLCSDSLDYGETLIHLVHDGINMWEGLLTPDLSSSDIAPSTGTVPGC